MHLLFPYDGGLQVQSSVDIFRWSLWVILIEASFVEKVQISIKKPLDFQTKCQKKKKIRKI